MNTNPGEWNLTPGAAAHGHLRIERKLAPEPPLRCEGVLAQAEDGREDFRPSGCDGHAFLVYELYIEQRERPRSQRPDRRCCLQCAVNAKVLHPMSLMLEVSNWLNSPRAQLWIATCLRRQGLPETYDTYVVDVVEDEARRYLASGKPIANVKGLCSTLISARSTRVHQYAGLGSEKKRLEVTAFDYEDNSGPVDPAMQEPPTFGVGADSDSIRSALAAHPAPIELRAAVLNYVTLKTENVEAGESCPQPKVDSRDSKDVWAALWYAGLEKCFAAPGMTDVAIRQNMKRTRDRLRMLFDEVKEMMAL